MQASPDVVMEVGRLYLEKQAQAAEAKQMNKALAEEVQRLKTLLPAEATASETAEPEAKE